MYDKTKKFYLEDEDRQGTKAVLRKVYDALAEKGYRPVNQIVGYLLSEDPTYITSHNNARSLMRQLDRDELLQELIESFLGIDPQDPE